MNQSLALGLVLSLVDKISGPLKAIERAQDSYNKSLNRLDTGLLKTSRSWDIFVKSVGKAGAPYQKVIEQANMMTELGQKMALRGAAGMAIGIVPVMDAAAVEQAMAEASTLGDMSAEEFSKRYGRAVMNISADYGQAQVSVVRAGYQALSKQVSADELVPFMNQTAKLAKAGVTDIFTATDLAITIKNAYKIPTAEMGKNFDLMFQTVRSGGTTLPQIAANFQTVGAAASSAGVSLANVQASVAQMTLSGVSTERAYTALRATITALRAPSSQAQKVFSQLGITMNAEVLQQQDLIGSMSMLEQKMSKMGVAERAAAMQDIFGSEEAMQFVNDFMKGGDQYKKMLASMVGSTGAMDGAVAKMDTTATNKWSKMWQAIKGISTALGNSLMPVIKVFLDIGFVVAKWLANFMYEHQILTGLVFGGVIAFFLLVTALGVLFIALGMVTKAAAGYRAGMDLIATQKGRVLTAINGMTQGVLSNLTGMGGGIASILPKMLSFGWIPLVIGGALVLLKKYWQPISAFVTGIGKGIMAVFSPFADFFKPILDGLSKVWGWLSSLNDPVNLNKAAFDKWIETGKTVGKVIAIIGGITLLFTPLGWLATLLFGIAWIIRRHWEPMAAFLKGFWKEFSAGIGPFNDGLSVMQNALGAISPLLDKFYDKLVKLGIIKESENDIQKFGKAGALLGKWADYLNYTTNPIMGFIMMLGKLKAAWGWLKIKSDEWAHSLLGRLYYMKIPAWLEPTYKFLTKITGMLDRLFGSEATGGAANKVTDIAQAAGKASKATTPTDNQGSWFDNVFGGAAVPKLALAGGGGRGATITFNGGINITIPGTNASPQEIAAAAQDGISKALRKAWGS